jgi:Tol biopolymer transport system component
MDADGRNVALLTDQAIYEVLAARDQFAAHQEFLAFAREVKHEDGQQRPAIFYYDYLANRAEQITKFRSSKAYQPAWSPTQERIAFVSDDSGAEEIWAVNRDGNNLSQLTRDDPTALDGHPSWSPDGSFIVFWSNRTGRKQIWVMYANGSGPRHLHQSDFNDWDPIWIKYTDFVARPVPGK